MTVSQNSLKNELLTKYGRVFQHENGLVHIYLNDDLSLDLPTAQQLVEDVRALDSSGQARLLVIQGINNVLSFDSQRYLGTVEGVCCLALVVQSRVQADIAQFFVRLLGMLRSSYEMRVFDKASLAEKWLLDKS